jgi:hypothetical protein
MVGCIRLVSLVHLRRSAAVRSEVRWRPARPGGRAAMAACPAVVVFWLQVDPEEVCRSNIELRGLSWGYAAW